MLRVSLTLFNLQGARRYLFETGLLYFSTTFRPLSRRYFSFFVSVFLFLRDSFNNIPPSPRFVKYFFHFFANARRFSSALLFKRRAHIADRLL